MSIAQYSAIVFGHAVNSKKEFEQYKEDLEDERKRDEFKREQARIAWQQEDKKSERQHEETMAKLSYSESDAKAARDLKILQEDLDYKFKVLDREQTHAQKMATVTEISQIRAALIGSLQELRNNPALEAQINQIAMALDTMQQALDRPELNTVEAQNKKELFEMLMAQLLVNMGAKPGNGFTPA